MLIEIPPVENGRYYTKDRYHIFELLISTSILHLQWIFRIIIANVFKYLPCARHMSRIFIYMILFNTQNNPIHIISIFWMQNPRYKEIKYCDQRDTGAKF